MIRVVVVDDELLVRSGFQLILNLAPDIEVVATADGPRALDVIALHQTGIRVSTCVTCFPRGTCAALSPAARGATE